MSSRMKSAVEVFAEALEAVERGQWIRAQALAESIIPTAPNVAGPYYIAGISALQLDQVQHAVIRLSRACALEPGRGDYQAQHARALVVHGDLPQAAAAARLALQAPSLDASALDTLGIVLGRAALHAEAAAAFERAVAARPSDPNLRYNLATSLMFHGDLAGAEREYEECLRLDPRHWRADFSIAQLRRQTADDNHVARLRQRLSRHAAEPGAQLYLNLALAKELEDLGQTGAAFDHYTSGKGQLGHRAKPLVDLAERCVTRLIERHATSPPDGGGYRSGEPVFIIGMPRSGTTLIDRIISSHDDVHPAGELDNFGMQLRRFSGAPARSLLETAIALPPGFQDWQRLGDDYVASTRPATGHTRRFTDKHPLNFLFVADIARALPGARIICMRRNPMDTCLSNFRQLFSTEAVDYDYSFDLLQTGRYYLLFDRLMRHWQSVLPGRILEVDYEVLVSAPEPTIRGVLEFCGLSWQEDCLSFERNSAAAASASAAQVRSPLNRDSLERWKRYGARLDALRSLLVAGGMDIGDNAPAIGRGC
ncbi:sulfotransferase [Luteimonas sp. MC1782]|uniref:tetratricopeptide repeat-containing sulfotransferase family protein n=1 Tax=Luteimonas sp. MC1782 TaxID=2760305 RepID=UPI001600B986|nr:sulfotransferase [Luteimonas sp. MC1782]MBB1472781.1 sulfotransferase [Luteimonas sp. MC1782]